MDGLPPGYSLLDIINPFGAPVLRAAETPSTMEDARRLVAAGAVSGTAVAADFQSAGRGRFRDRSWSGERGRDLLFTVMLKLDAARAAAFPLRLGYAVCRALEALGEGTGAGFEVKWPNDLLCGGKKVSGILCESSGGWYYAGVGLNCAAREFPPGLRHPATSLEAVFGKPVERFEALGFILRELSRSFENPTWLSALETRLYGRGKRLRFLDGMPEEGRIVDGILSGLGKGGELLIDVNGKGIRPFVSGEILFEPLRT
jgi:BirA family transcriptional regulator, biotin operon repressor / biotin---[acetyl-CoA-carboxylase] ligase